MAQPSSEPAVRRSTREQGPADPPRSSRAAAGKRSALQVVLIGASIVALLLTSSALNLVSRARAADAPKRAVIVVGPTHSATTKYLQYGRTMARVAEAHGMAVTRIFHPNATPQRVKRIANGADLFVYIGHGNGWPSIFPPFQERTKDGLGLNPPDGDRTTSNVLYKGADWVREKIHLAPNAVVIFNHLSYASGNASSGMPIPTQDVAVQRIDNFAAAFLFAGARVVWALGWQPGGDVIDALFDQDTTMDGAFMTQVRAGSNPYNGWMGYRPDLYFESQRTPGAEIHIDPHPDYGFLRAVTGDLSMTTEEWRTGVAIAPPEDTEPPVLSAVRVTQAAATLATAADSAPVFTPNGDGISDTIAIKHTLSEPAYLDIDVIRAGNERTVRHMTSYAPAGRGSTFWDGERDSGKVTGEGTYRIVLTPRDRAGNVGEPASVTVTVLTALRAPKVKPSFFFPSDGDLLSTETLFKTRLTKPGTVTWVVRDQSGSVVRTGMDAVEADVGRLAWRWDGRDDDGRYVPLGTYESRVTITRPAGTYGHEVSVQVMPFLLAISDPTPVRRQRLKVTIRSAEPLGGRPRVLFRQPGYDRIAVRVHRVSATRFVAHYRVRSGGADGFIKVIVDGTDTGGGHQRYRFKEIVLH